MRVIKPTFFPVLAASLMLATTAHADDDNRYVTPRSVSVTGYAEAKLAPEQAVISITVHSESKNLDAAKKEQDEKVKKLINLTREMKIDKDDVRTLYANVRPEYEYIRETGKQKFRNYALENQIEITVKILDRAGPLMDKLIDAGFDRIGNLRFELENERKHREALMTEALQQARDKAAKMAEALGAKLGRPLTISESGAYNPPPMPMGRTMAMAESADMAKSASMPTYTPIGVIDIQQTVNVTFELE